MTTHDSALPTVARSTQVLSRTAPARDRKSVSLARCSRLDSAKDRLAHRLGEMHAEPHNLETEQSINDAALAEG